MKNLSSVKFILLLSLLLMYAVRSGSQQLTPPPSYISRFDLVQVPSGDTLEKLYDDIIITTTQSFAIVARIDGTPNTVTFLNPFFQIEREAPYAIPANFPAGQLRPLKLTVGSYLVSAYVNDAAWNVTTIRIFIRPENVPPRGPMPNEITPKYEDPAFSTIMVPMTTCTAPMPSITVKDLSFSNMSNSIYQISVVLKLCSDKNATNKLRLRVLSFDADDGGQPEVVVLWAKIVSSGLVQVPINVRCEKIVIYGEACVDTSSSKMLCATTNFRTVPPLPVTAPILSLTPPKVLELSPGDQAKLVFRITNNTGSPYWGGVRNGKQPYTLQLFMVDANGSEIARWSKSTQNFAVARIGGKLCGIPPSLDGAKISLRYFESECGKSGTFLGIFETVLSVSTSIVSLSMQDVRPPHFPQPMFPETIAGMQTRIAVAAVNRGNGERADGSATKLQYQWLKKVEASGSELVYPSPISSANGPSLLISKAECDPPCGTIDGCSSSVSYFVDVCNTFGCRRSAAIKPHVLPPNSSMEGGKMWNGSSCSWE